MALTPLSYQRPWGRVCGPFGLPDRGRHGLGVTVPDRLDRGGRWPAGLRPAICSLTRRRFADADRGDSDDLDGAGGSRLPATDRVDHKPDRNALLVLEVLPPWHQ